MDKKKKSASRPPASADYERMTKEELIGLLKKMQEESPASGDSSRLLHELQVHRIELEMQNKELRESRARLEEAIGRLAGGIAHDFNNLTIIIKMNSDLAAKELDAGSPARAYLGQISDASSRAADLTRQLLIYGSRREPSPEPVNLNGTVADMFKILNRFIGEKITIKRELDPGLPAIMADKSNIEQMIMNLVINARDAMPGGGLITMKTWNEGGSVCLSVDDTGAGMDREVIKHIFEPFFSTKGGKGTGLGLAVVHSVVKESGGSVTVYSPPGQGSTFKVVFPAAPEKPGVEKREEGVEDLAGKGERVLLVEDEAQLRKSVALILGRNGYKVFEASDAGEAMELFEKENGRFDIVFTDMVLQDMTGLQLAERLRAGNNGLRVLLTSGYVDTEARWPLIREKGLGFLQKPYEIDDMLRAVKRSAAGR
ncbi:MAG: ATP-binding protein [Deltaproteobacteria bacterium]|nr:ATP-binding protein [Deltaproteobacteria bacterium]